jgi:L-alanine-DL-glutamate epimerase-like enolase superfamily enzyme
MRLDVQVETKVWTMHEPFAISRGVQTETPTIVVSLIDLDGPLLQAGDWPDGLIYTDGVIALPESRLWG